MSGPSIRAALALALAASAAAAQEAVPQEPPPAPLTEELLPENFVDARAGVVTIEPRHGDAPLPGAGYDMSPGNGAFIQSADGSLRLQIGAYTQIRWNLNQRDAPAGEDPDFGEEDLTTGWSLNRTRLFLEGRFTEDFTYHFRTNTSGSEDTELLVAWGQYRIDDRWAVRVGKQFMPLSREDWMYAQDLLTTEFSPNDFTYAIGPSLGGFVSYQADAHRWWLGLHNGAYGGREDFPAPEESDIAATARVELALAGDDWSVWDDVVGRPGRAEGVLLGLAGGYQTSKEDVDGGEREGAQLNADLSLDGDGYHALLAASATWRDPEDASEFANYGALAQIGWFVSSRGQLYAQYNWLGAGSQPGDLQDFNSLTLGYNWFPFLWTNRWKLSVEGGYLFSALSDTVVEPSSALGWFPSDERGQAYLRLQAQIGF